MDRNTELSISTKAVVPNVLWFTMENSLLKRKCAIFIASLHGYRKLFRYITVTEEKTFSLHFIEL